MKRFRIWIKYLTLIEQFISISFMVVIVFLLFFFTFIPNNINNFINSQMYDYIHSSQNDYISRTIYGQGDYQEETSDVSHYLYSDDLGRYLTYVDDESTIASILNKINLNIIGSDFDGVLEYEDTTYIYSIRKISYNNGSFTLVSIVSNEYRSAMSSALANTVVNATTIMVIGIYFFLSIWVFSLIRPLNSIRLYIDRLRKGEKPTLKIYRHDEIGEVAEALVHMNDELSKQNRIREEMIQNISHDLKTPIATIKSYSESIKDGVYPYDTLEKSVDVIIEHADRLEKKVYSLITFNKMGYLEDDGPVGDNVKMIDVVQDAILAANVLRGDIKIETDLEDIYFHGTKENWLIVIENLLDNALRYAKTVVKISLDAEELTIYNDGELMDKDRINTLFKPYEMGNKGKFGLGLSIVKRVVETYGYHVLGENMDDGVIFRIIKPKAKKRKKEVKNKIDEASE